MLTQLRASYPQYNKAITFVNIDWDTYRTHKVTTSRKVPRRSTFIMIKSGKEIGRLVAATSTTQIKALLDKAIAKSN